jgi:hypothetical protein
MGLDDRRLLEILKSELDFLRRGGYRDPERAKGRAQFIFEDSPTCINYRNLGPRKPCTECFLMDMVPFEHRNEPVPCRWIPLNDQGETIDSLYRYGTQEEIEKAVASWLKKRIEQLESA